MKIYGKLEQTDQSIATMSRGTELPTVAPDGDLFTLELGGDDELYLRKDGSWVKMVLASSSGKIPTNVMPAYVSSLNGNSGAITLQSGDVTGALGFTPYNATNPSNFIAASGAPVQSVFGRTGTVSIQSGDVTGALGFTPYNATNPASYITSAGVPVQSVLGRTGTVTLTQADVTGVLDAGSITNTMLANSAVANLSGTNTGDQTTISGNAGTATVLQTARTINGVSFDGSTNITINAVDSTARIASSLIGAVNGVAGLDATGKVPAAQLPSYVDDVVEGANLAAFPATGETGKIYVALDTNKCYRWSGSVYVYITSGAVDSVAGKTGAVTLTSADVGLGNVSNQSAATIQAGITSSNVTTALGFTPYNATNPESYITSAGAPVQSVFGRTGTVALTQADVTSVLGAGSITNTMLSNSAVANLSGTNSGDETLATIKSKLGITTLSGSNTGDQTITLTGDVTGSGTGSFATTLANSGVSAGSYTKLTVNTKGLVTSAGSITANDIEAAMAGTGAVIQSITSVVPAATGTSIITLANATPTTAMGSQIWSNTITPSAITSHVRVSGGFTFVSGTNSRILIIFVFRGTTCIGTTGVASNATTTPYNVKVDFVDSPASTSAQTYSIRVGVTSAATWYINQFATAYFNGTLALSNISLDELA